MKRFCVIVVDKSKSQVIAVGKSISLPEIGEVAASQPNLQLAMLPDGVNLNQAFERLCLKPAARGSRNGASRATVGKQGGGGHA